MSREGIEPCCSDEVLRNVAVICSFVCLCDGKGGQKCVDSLLLLHNAATKESQILAEHPYYIPKEGSPIPLIPKGGWEEKICSLGRMIGAARLAKTEGIPQDVMEDYLNGGLKYRDIREKGYEDIKKYEKGELSIPDTVIVRDRNAPAVGDNMLGVAEIKYPPDDWQRGQFEAASRIAGGDDKVHTLTPTSCKCSNGEQELDEKAGQPAIAAAARKEQQEAAQKQLVMLQEAAALAYLASKSPAGLFFDILLTPTPAY